MAGKLTPEVAEKYQVVSWHSRIQRPDGQVVNMATMPLSEADALYASGTFNYIKPRKTKPAPVKRKVKI